MDLARRKLNQLYTALTRALQLDFTGPRGRVELRIIAKRTYETMKQSSNQRNLRCQIPGEAQYALERSVINPKPLLEAKGLIYHETLKVA